MSRSSPESRSTHESGSTHPSGSPHESRAPERVPVGELVDLSRLGREGRAPTPREIRAALPRGWVLEADSLHARRDLRLFFREAWILLVGLVCFGSAGVALFWSTFPRGMGGVLRLAVLLALLILLGGVLAPRITRALYRRQ